MTLRGEMKRLVSSRRAGMHGAVVPFSGRPIPQRLNIIQVRNDSGAAVAKFGVLGISDPIYTPAANLDKFKEHVMLSGVTPTADHEDAFAILFETLGVGAVGEAVICGVVQVQVDVVAEADDVCGAAAGDVVKLKSGVGSNRILWKESGTGTKWAIVRLGGAESGFDRITGLTTAAVEATDETFTIDNIEVVKGADPREDTESTSETVVVYNSMTWESLENALCYAEWNPNLDSGNGAFQAYQLDGCNGS